MDISDVLEKYKQNKQDYVVSDKQKDFVESLINQVYPDQDLFSIITKLLERPVTSWSDLKYRDINILIAKLINRKPATKKQIDMITRSYSIDDINTFLKIQPPFTDYDQLNHWHIKRLITPIDKFNLRPNDHPIISNIDYEYGYQDSELCLNNRLYYLKLYDLMMIDYDDIDYQEVIKLLRPYQNYMLFSIYQTFNGYHVFIMSDTYNHNTTLSTKLMTSLGCDKYYIMFCYKNGYKIRLSPKLNRDETYIAKYIGDYGNIDLINPICKDLLNIHNKYLKI